MRYLFPHLMLFVLTCCLVADCLPAQNTAQGGELGPLSSRIKGYLVDSYALEIEQGAGTYIIELESKQFDTYVVVVSPDGEFVVNDDHEGSNQRSLVRLVEPASGTWRVLVTSHSQGSTGDYSVKVSPHRELQKEQNWSLAPGLADRIFDRPRELLAHARAEFSSSEFSIPDLLLKFPWPPPHASAVRVLPQGMVGRPQERELRLSDVDQRLTSALESAGYHEMVYFGVPEGFAIVTRLEQIDIDGTPKDVPARWAIELPPLERFTLREYAQALFGARVGYFRVLVFIVSSRAFHQSDEETRFRAVIDWLREGANKLPDPIGSRSYSDRHRTTVLIYEFEKIRGSGAAELLVPGRLDGESHLRRAGIMAGLEK